MINSLSMKHAILFIEITFYNCIVHNKHTHVFVCAYYDCNSRSNYSAIICLCLCFFVCVCVWVCVCVCVCAYYDCAMIEREILIYKYNTFYGHRIYNFN